jgi:phosphoribosylaminoimidazole-succinocarboxamide synthase
MFAAINIRLVDFKLEFGRIWDGDYSRIILADEISPDGCRLWDMTTGEKLDKDRFRRDLGGEEEAYQEVAAAARYLGLLDLSAHRKLRGK